MDRKPNFLNVVLLKHLQSWHWQLQRDIAINYQKCVTTHSSLKEMEMQALTEASLQKRAQILVSMLIDPSEVPVEC